MFNDFVDTSKNGWRPVGSWMKPGCQYWVTDGRSCTTALFLFPGQTRIWSSIYMDWEITEDGRKVPRFKDLYFTPTHAQPLPYHEENSVQD